MTYDTYGNIVSKNGKTYSYDSTWKDLLLSVDGEPIVYDAQGNPTTYLGHTLTWEKGRQLKSFDGNTYTYNANGIRTSKTVNGVKHTYTLDGTKILREEWNGNVLIPLYDNEDSVCGIIYNTFPYYFLKNLQGDVIAITNSKGNVVAQYTYDAWGECTIVSDTTGIIARINPFRYRGYYFDQEIGLYYLQSRYYNAGVPECSLLSINPIGHNLFSYCINNPANLSDPMGYIAIFDDLAVWAFISLCSILIALISWMSTAEFRMAWTAFCKDVGNGLSWMGTGIVNGGKAAWGWTRKNVKAATAAITTFTSIIKAQSKVNTKVKSARRNWNNFFEIWFDQIGAPILGKPLNRNQAVTRARRGLNSITYYSSDALYVANRAGSSRAMWHQRHGGPGYFNHYHINGHKNSAHIYYIITG